MKKDILFLCQFFYPSRLSSAILPYETAKALVQEGFTVDVITGKVKRKDVKTPKKEQINGINIKRLTYYQGKSKKKIPRLISYATYILANYINIFKFKKYKVIILYSNPPILPKIALLANKWFGPKIIYVSYDEEYIEKINLWQDIKFFIKTFFVVFKREGVSSPGMEMAPNLGQYLLKSGQITRKYYNETVARTKQEG